jgi:hypothetical protein
VTLGVLSAQTSVTVLIELDGEDLEWDGRKIYALSVRELPAAAHQMNLGTSAKGSSAHISQRLIRKRQGSHSCVTGIGASGDNTNSFWSIFVGDL